MKRQPCTSCAARGGKKHAVGCSRRLKVTTAVAAATKHPTARPNEVQRNRISLVLDGSTSMRPFRANVERTIEAQVAEIKKNAAKLGQPTSLSIYVFSDPDRVRKIVDYEDVFEFKSFEYPYPDGWTALFDGVGLSINDFLRGPYSQDPNTSFLVITITDGEENRSRNYTAASLAAVMREVERTDRWTFVFSVPKGGRRQLATFGIPEGNIQEWEQTTAGIDQMSQTTSMGIGSYMTMRSAGLTRCSNFFEPNMAAVSKTAIRKLDDLSRDFHAWNVDRESPIREFVEDKLAQQPALARSVGRLYQVGRGYYQLTKAEEVQANKDMVILDKSTNALYGGDQARELIGCPMGMSFKIKPGNLANYEIYVKSTSVNRKLMRGTKVLYFVG